MFRLAILAALAAAAYAQNPDNPFEKVPEDVDKALRARITEFFQDHVDGQFRKAEALVAEDTKDLYYSQNKPKYLSFEIARIIYSDNFTKAAATVMCEQIIMFPGFAGKPMKVPTNSTWKLENGKWYWYIDPAVLRRFPFGPAAGSEAAKTAAAGGANPTAPAGATSPLPSFSSIPTSADFVLHKLKADKQEIELAGSEPVTVTLTNTATGPMSFELKQGVHGVDISP
ncbi:MAG TPA: hypothetical protein VGF59_28305, partial [Bryobacteraceae bacterium]